MSNEDWHRAAAGTAGTRFQPWLRLQALPERGPALPHRAEAGGHSEPGGEGGRGGLWSRSVAGVGAPGWGQSVDVMISGLLAGAPRPASRAAQRSALSAGDSFPLLLPTPAPQLKINKS